MYVMIMANFQPSGLFTEARISVSQRKKITY